MSWRNDVESKLAADDIPAALLALADAVDQLWSERAKAERLQRLAEEGFQQGNSGA
jgi:hypothetical protein